MKVKGRRKKRSLTIVSLRCIARFCASTPFHAKCSFLQKSKYIMMLTNKVMKLRHILICVGKKAGGKLFAGDYNVSSFFLSFFFFFFKEV